MALSHAAAGAAQGLEELLARQLLEAKLEEEKRQTNERVRLEQARLNQQAREAEDLNKYRADSLEQNDRERRDRSNVAGVEEMHRQRGVMDEEEDKRAVDEIIAGMPEGSGRRVVGLRRRKIQGVSAEDIETPEEKAARTKGEVDKAGAVANAQYGAAARHREPDKQWVIDAKGDVVERVGRTQPGDKPYDEVAARQKPDGGPSDYSAERSKRTLDSVKELKGKVGRWTTGMGGVAMRNIPETDARNFASELNTLKANIAFNELTQMREASKTGGALGQVSNIELQLLESALGALDQGQSPDNLRAQLEKIEGSIERFNRARGGSATAGGGAGTTTRMKFDAKGNPIP